MTASGLIHQKIYQHRLRTGHLPAKIRITAQQNEALLDEAKITCKWLRERPLRISAVLGIPVEIVGDTP